MTTSQDAPGGPEDTASGHDALGAAQQGALRRATRLEQVTVLWKIVTVVLVVLVAGQSQAMRVSWIEDALSVLPPLAFLVAARRIRRPPDRRNPYGHHRSIGVAHLVGAVSLLAVGGFLAVDSAHALIATDRPPVGITVVLGHAVWAGWIMIAVTVVTTVPAVVLARLKLGPAEDLHDKVLYADADMGKADWASGLATVLGVLGIGAGLWWADGAAALLMSVSIVRDGVTNLRGAVAGLTDAEARTFDDAKPHPLTRDVERVAHEEGWVAEARARVRDEGHVFHVELFLVPHDEQRVDVEALTALRERIQERDWKLHDVVVVPVPRLPAEQVFPAEGVDPGTPGPAS